jgi:hypothetical protein
VIGDYRDTLPADTAQRLKEDARTCLDDDFYLILEDVDRVCLSKRKSTDKGYARFLDVVIRRLKRLTSLHT